MRGQAGLAINKLALTPKQVLEAAEAWDRQMKRSPYYPTASIAPLLNLQTPGADAERGISGGKAVEGVGAVVGGGARGGDVRVEGVLKPFPDPPQTLPKLSPNPSQNPPQILPKTSPNPFQILPKPSQHPPQSLSKSSPDPPQTLTKPSVNPP